MRSISARHTATLRPCYALLSALCELWVVIWICDSQEWHWIMTLSRQLFGIKSYGWHQVGHRLWCRLYTCIAWCTLHHVICTRQRHMHYSTPYALQHLMQNRFLIDPFWRCDCWLEPDLFLMVRFLCFFLLCAPCLFGRYRSSSTRTNATSTSSCFFQWYDIFGNLSPTCKHTRFLAWLELTWFSANCACTLSHDVAATHNLATSFLFPVTRCICVFLGLSISTAAYIRLSVSVFVSIMISIQSTCRCTRLLSV